MPLDSLNAAFITLLKADIDNPGFKVTESLDKQEIIITPSDGNNPEQLFGSLKEIFMSHGHTAEHIPYVVSSNTEVQQQNSEQSFTKATFPLLDIQNLNCNELFTRLFDEDTRKTNGNIKQWIRSKGQNNQTVYFYICQSEIEANLRKAQIDIFKSILSHATWEDLYSALAAEVQHSRHLPIHDSLFSIGNGPLSPHLDSLFRIQKEDENFVVRFDCLGLLKCIIPPKFSLEPETTQLSCSSNGGGTIEIHLNKSHFMAYMSTLLNHGFLLHENSSNKLIPIILHGKNAIQVKTLINFGIDCSGSMHDVFSNLKKLLMTLLTKLSEKLDVHATHIIISRFGSRNKKFPTIEFPLNELGKQIESISRELSNPTTNEQTALYQFLHEQYNSFKKFHDHNIISVLISDGGDNDSDSRYIIRESGDDLISIVLNSLEKEISPPQFFSLEIGTLVDQILETIANKTHGTRIKVGNDLRNFNYFFEYLDKLGIHRYFLNFMQETRKFRLPVIDGEITMPLVTDPDSYITPGIPFEINNTSYIAQKQLPIPENTDLEVKEYQPTAEVIEQHRIATIEQDRKTKRELELEQQIELLKKELQAKESQSSSTTVNNTTSRTLSVNNSTGSNYSMSNEEPSELLPQTVPVSSIPLTILRFQSDAQQERLTTVAIQSSDNTAIPKHTQTKKLYYCCIS